MGFARVLKDGNGDPSGYRECDGEVAYMPKQQSYENIFHLVQNIDIDTMEIVNHDFIKDCKHVYRRGKLLQGISPEDFHKYNAIYVGNHQVIYTPYGNGRIAHPESFEVLDAGGIPEGEVFPASYGRDSEFVYYFTGSTDTTYAVRLKACHTPLFFTVLKWGYAMDEKHAYFREHTIKYADPKTFEVLTAEYARDRLHVFIRDRAFKADPKTFFILQDTYAQDCDHMYRNGFIVDDVNRSIT